MQGFQYHAAYRVGRIGRHHERGIAMPFFAAGLVVILAMVGLALDLGHAYVNKTRLQNAIDAATLSAAKTLDDHKASSSAAARKLAIYDAYKTLNFTLEEDGNQYFEGRFNRIAMGDLDAMNADDSNNLEDRGDGITIEFFDELEPLTVHDPTSLVPPSYVRISTNALQQDTWFIQILPGIGNELTVGSSAVAGPSPSLGTNGGEVCNVFPAMLCEDPAETGDDYIFGYEIGKEHELTIPPGTNSDVGPGNFRLLRIDGSGGDVLRHNLAGQYDACIDSNMTAVDTEPGLTAGPTRQGINTRFGIYDGPMNNETYKALYRPDTNTCFDTDEPFYSYAEYLSADLNADGFPKCIADTSNIPDSQREFRRREIVIPMADCSGDNSGQSTLPLAGFACMFLTRPVAGTGSDIIIYAEMLPEGCNVSGSFGLPDTGPVPATGPGPYMIILYADPRSPSGAG